MPFPFTGNRGIAQAYLSGLIEEGLSNSYIVDFLRLNDLGYATQRMYRDINRVRLENFGALSLPSLDPSLPIPENLMRQWHGSTEFEYRVVIKYEYFNKETLSTEKGGTTLYYNERPSQDEVMEDWIDRKATLQTGFGTDKNVQEVFGSTQIMYYRNSG